MKSGYKKLLIFEIPVFLLLIINVLTTNFLSGYKMLIFLVLLLFLFNFLFGFERDNHRYVKDVIIDITIFLIIFFLMYYLLGIVFGFAKNNYFNLDGFVRFIIPNAIYIILREYFRYNAICKSGNNKLLIIFTIVLFITFDISETFYYVSLGSGYSIFVFVAVYLIPSICNNLVFSYTTSKVGYKPVIYYSLIVNLYSYLLPIIPNPNQYIQSLILLILPVIFGYRILNFFGSVDEEELERNYYKKKHSLKSLGVVAVFIMIIIYFVSGYFRYWAIVIASGSMADTINKGDVVIIHKINDGYEKLELNQIIAYKHNGKIVVHRIVDKIKIEGKYYFITKGDMNTEIDNVIIEEDMIVGTINIKIPYLGLPTIWINEL